MHVLARSSADLARDASYILGMTSAMALLDDELSAAMCHWLQAGWRFMIGEKLSCIL